MNARTMDDELHELTELSREQLVESWQALLGSDPPKGISTQLMARAVGYEMQAKRFGGLKSATLRKLQKLAGGSNGSAEARASASPRPPFLDAGARLIREWNGVTHTVEVTDGGFDWRGERYGSLSEIAREITGARWSGPRFFGLNRRAVS